MQVPVLPAKVCDINMKLSTRQIRVLVCISVTAASGSIIAAFNAPFFPPKAEEKGATQTQYGLMLGLSKAMSIFASPLFGKLVAHVNPKYLLCLGQLLMGIFIALFGMLDALPPGQSFIISAFVVLILLGMSTALHIVCVFTIIMKEFSENVGTSIGVTKTIVGVGFVLGPIIGGAIYSQTGRYSSMFVCLGVWMCILSIFTFFMLPKSEYNVEYEKGAFWKFWTQPLLILYSSMFVATYIAMGFLEPTLEPALRPYHLSPVMIGAVFIIPYAAYAVATPFWGLLCDSKINTKLACIIAGILLLTGLTIMGPVYFLPFSPSLPSAIVSLVLYGVGNAGCIVSCFVGALKDSIAIGGHPNDIRTFGLVSSMQSVTSSLGGFIGPSLGGYLLDHVGFRKGIGVPILINLVMMVVMILYYLYMKYAKTVPSPEEKPLLDKDLVTV